ncbi:MULTISPECIES: MarR family winged helix-turn-helix transcriptional regulator [unclassified Nocardioides]|uniref:MarR family winged helix-turn-helix transcriptional regulator n=1 Tax=unclassified Nocardioides TaxID=2615069 RepID=UPI0009EF9D65|nr:MULTISPECIES: MarR family transcriptional regulator [unclassified Nocardioides]GAW50919.1 Transcriptional regulator, MarR family [Nocardioides sp. PD653-B2]GAW56354.1 Transcriptional regulator, MarR family [Nocardioides sp. PD653]
MHEFDSSAAPPFAAAVRSVLTASRALVAVSARSLAALGEEVTLPEYRALVLLARTGGSRVIDLAGAMSLNPSTVSRMCDRLLRKGLVSRTSEESDRRAVRLTLTETGRALVDEVTRARTVEIESIVARVSPAHRALLVAGFQAFADAAGEVGDDLWPTAVLGWLPLPGDSSAPGEGG